MESSLDPFFNPRSIAVVGASAVPGKLSRIIMESLDRSGFAGEVYPVNPKYSEVMGRRCYPDIGSIGECVDLAVFAVPASAAVRLMKEASGRVRGAIVISGGFSETGREGRAAEEELKRAAKEGGVRVIGPNCMGIYDTVSSVDTLFVPEDRVRRPPKGSIAVLSQSGSFALTAMDELAAESIGVSRVVSYGNKIDVSEADCLEFLADDDATRAVVLYIEGINDGRRFVEAAKRCSEKKTLMALKVGRHGAGKRAASSHTGAIAGRYELYRAAFKKASIIELSGYEDIIDGCRALAANDPVDGRRVMIVTDGGGMGVGIADACSEVGLVVVPLPEEKKEVLRPVFPGYFTVNNPLDLTGSVTDEWFEKALSVALDGDDYDLAIVAALWGPPHLTDRLPELLAGAARSSGKPVIVCSPGGEYTRKRRALFEDVGLAVFSTPESAVRAASILLARGVQR